MLLLFNYSIGTNYLFCLLKIALHTVIPKISNLRDRLNRELRAKRQQESDTGPNIFSDDLLDSRPVFDKSVRGVDVGGNSAYFNEVPNKRSTSPAKVISTRVTRHNTPSHQKAFSPKKSFRSSSRK